LDNKNKIRIAFGIVILSMLVGIAFGGGLIGLLSLFADTDQPTMSITAMGISTIFMAIPVLVYLKYRHIPFKFALRLNGISIRSLSAVLFLSIGIIILIDEIDRLVYILFGQPEYLEELAEQLKITTIYSGIAIVITTILIAPLIEELLFRGYFQKVLEDEWQDVTKAILVTGIFFAFVHMNPYWIVQIYLLGVVLGYLAWRTNSIVPSLILHGLNNGFAVALNNCPDIFIKYYNWHCQVNPIWLMIAIIFVILGYRYLNHDIESPS
jgi:membrane protease YdiL (CAAX protease family)